MAGDSELTYQDVLSYITTYAVDSVPPYDANGIIHLMLAALSNLNQYWVESDPELIGDLATPEERQRLIEIGRFLETYIPEDD